MCGIFGYLGKKNALPLILEGLRKLEYRGYDSAGIALVSGSEIKRRRVKGKVSSLEENLKGESLEGDYGLGHTRWATHGCPSEENAHPHLDCRGEITVVHNGIIENYLDLKSCLEAKGHSFSSETDSEVIAHLIEENMRDTLEDAVLQAVKNLEGAFAFAVLSLKDPYKIVAAKKGPPGVIGIGEGEYFISSDLNPLFNHTSKVVFLEDNEVVVIKQEGVSFFNFSGNPIKKQVEELTWSPLMIEKQGFKHFMLKEIFEQPQVLRETMEGRISFETGEVKLNETGLSLEIWRKIRKVTVIACGTSFHAGLVGKYYLETLAEVPAEVVHASEYRYQDQVINPETLFILISQSGETADTLAALRLLREKKALSLAVSNVVKSSVAREADGVFYTRAGPEVGVAATKTFTAQMTAMLLLALGLAQIKKGGVLSAHNRLLQEIRKIPHKMEAALAKKNEIDKFSAQFMPFKNFLYLGRWVNYPIALEGALKLKEISYIHAEGYPGGEMKHGPIALIDENMPTLAISPRDRVYGKMLSNISEIKARQGYVAGVAFKDDEEIRDKVDYVLDIPSTESLLTPFLTLIPLQLFAYSLASRKGADVDQPRNLAKSVTVE